MTRSRLPALSDSPFVSILSTSYNHARWVADTLASVAAQRYEHLEHVIVDDGSTDGSLDELNAVPRAAGTVFTTAHVGQARALNEAYDRSKGEIIGWLSSDDVYFSRDVVSRVVAEFQRNVDVGLVYGHSVLIDASGSLLRTSWAPPLPDLWRRVLRIMFVQPAVFVRRDAVGSRFVDPSLDIAMDNDLFHRIASEYAVARVPIIVAAERHHASRKSYLLDDRMRREDEILRERWPSIATSTTSDAVSRLAVRFMGATLVPRACRTEIAYDGRNDGILRVLGRQLFVRRRRMTFLPDTREGIR